MAVRFSATGQHYSRSLALGAVSSFSVACWVKLAANRAATSVVWQIDNGSGVDYLRINAYNGTTLTYQSDEWFAFLGRTLTVGTWCYIGLSVSSAGGVSLVTRDAASDTFNSGEPGDVASVFNAATLRIGASHATGEWINGSVAALKVWDGRLSTSELENEFWSYLPQRTTNLRAWYPLTTPETPDFSGNGNTLTGGTGATVDDGPPISWGGPGIVSSVRLPQVVVPAGQVSEADTAQTVQATKWQSFGQAVDAGAALQVTAYKVRPISQAIELDTGQPISVRPTVDPAAETQAARPIARFKVRMLGQIVEVGSAAAVTLVRSCAAFTAVDAQAAQPVISAKRKLAGQAAETSQARPAAMAKARPVGVIAELDVAQVIRRPLLVWRIAETDVAQPIRPARVRDLGSASEVAQAHLVVGARGGRVGQAVEFSTVRPAERTKQQLISQAAETDIAMLVRRSGARFRVVRTYRRWSAGSPYRKYTR
ncbi:LamG-like jellyroll fold domain-containing protein [Streptosporangium canum]|uniref:LamG-like jellyroll fold domain-containing protein n=1 Tax=Streptosporangium canum TaxID=324952 RepID=UPI0037B2A6D8